MQTQRGARHEEKKSKERKPWQRRWQTSRSEVSSRKNPQWLPLSPPLPVSPPPPAPTPAPGRHKRGFDCNRKPLRRGEPSLPPLLGPRRHPPSPGPLPCPSPHPAKSALTSLVWASPSLSHLPLPPPPCLRKTPPRAPQVGPIPLGLTLLGGAYFGLKYPLQFLE